MLGPHHAPAQRSVSRWLPVVAWMGVIFWLSSLTSTGLPSGFSSPGHFTVYAILGALLVRAIGRTTPPLRAMALAVLISSAYGITDEIHQAFVPPRMPDVVDWGFDTLGALCGAAALIALWHMLDRRA